MFRTSMALAGALAAGLPLAAAAQSGVTLYGIADAAVESIRSGSASARRLQSGGLYQSRWGLRGQEDLGGGLRALFNLENRFNIDDGSNFQGQAFGARAVVGLAGPWGQVVLGREYVPLYDIKVQSNPFAVDPYSAPQVMMRGGASRADNALRYESPRLAGFGLGLMHSAGDENPADGRAGRHTGLALQQQLGELWLGAGWHRIAVRSAAVDHTDEALLGARWRVGRATLYAHHWLLRTDNRATPDGDVRLWTLGAAWRLSDAGVALASVSRRDTRAPLAAAADDARQVLVGYEHNLSRRTTLYAQATRVTNKARSNLTVSGFANTGVGGPDVSDPRAVQVGVRHSF